MMGRARKRERKNGDNNFRPTLAIGNLLCWNEGILRDRQILQNLFVCFVIFVYFVIPLHGGETLTQYSLDVLLVRVASLPIKSADNSSLRGVVHDWIYRSRYYGKSDGTQPAQSRVFAYCRHAHKGKSSILRCRK